MEETSTVTVRLSALWETMKRHWLILLIVFVATFGVSFAVAAATHVDEYSARVSIYVMRDRAAGSSSGNLTSSDFTMADKILTDCQKLFLSDDNVLKPVIEKQNLNGVLSVKGLKEMIKISKEPDTRIMNVTVTSQNAERSVELCNALTEVACDYCNQLLNFSEQKVCQIIDRAYLENSVIPSNPISKVKLMLIAVLVTMLVYIGLFLITFLDDKINSAEDVEKYLGVNMLGFIPNRDKTERKRSRYGIYYRSGSSASGRETGGQGVSR